MDPVARSVGSVVGNRFRNSSSRSVPGTSPPTASTAQVARAPSIAGSVMIAANRSWAMRALAPEWSRIRATSPAVRSVFIGRKYQPASWQAREHSTISTPLGSITATAAPGWTPTLLSAWTNWCAAPASSANVRVPDGDSRIAGWSGWSSAIHQTPSLLAQGCLIRSTLLVGPNSSPIFSRRYRHLRSPGSGMAGQEKVETGTPFVEGWIEAGVGVLRLNRPERRNALHPDMYP